MTTAWTNLTKEQKGALIRSMIVDQQISYSKIGLILGVSRVAIAGAANRNGITSPYSRGVQPGVRGAQAAAANKARALGGIAATKRTKGGKIPTAPRRPPTPGGDMPRDRRPEQAAAWVALEGTTPRSLAEHEPGQCLWPIDGPNGEMLFCCAPVEKGNWCAPHRAIGYKPTPPLKLNGRKTA